MNTPKNGANRLIWWIMTGAVGALLTILFSWGNNLSTKVEAAAISSSLQEERYQQIKKVLSDFKADTIVRLNRIEEKVDIGLKRSR